LIASNALHMPFRDESRSVIIAIHCFDHLDRTRFLRECSRVLRVGGLLLFDFLNRHSYKVMLKKLLRRLRFSSAPGFEDKWLNVWSYSEALQAIDGAGCTVHRAMGYGWIPFSVDSESKLVPRTGRAERALRLGGWPNVSPRVLVAARKLASGGARE
jgi:SAM-dependent methyltransferase